MSRTAAAREASTQGGRAEAVNADTSPKPTDLPLIAELLNAFATVAECERLAAAAPPRPQPGEKGVAA